MKIDFWIKSLSTMGGGAENVLCQVTKALSNRGHEIRVITWDKPGAAPFYSLSDHIQLNGLSLPIRHGTSLITAVRVALLARKITAEGRPDVVVAFMHSSFVPVSIGLVGTGVPIIACEHTSSAHYSSRPLEQRLVRFSQKLVRFKTVVSPIVLNEHSNNARSNVRVMPNPVDLERYSLAGNDQRTENVILGVGVFRKEKDFVTLVDAFERIAQEHPSWRLRIVGDGPMAPEIRTRVARSPYRGRIELPGMLRDLAAEYSRASIVAIPSRYEAMPMVAMEALASARPIIGFSDCAGAREMIYDMINGILVSPDPCRTSSLAVALDKLIRDRDLRVRLGSAGPSTIEKFSVQAISDRWEAMLCEAAATGVGE